MKRTAISTLISALVFGILATLLGPKMIAYWYTPPVPTAFACTEQINWAMHRLIWTQLIGTGLGFVIGLVLGIVFRSKKPPDVPVAAPVSSVTSK
jgi:tellurite resistance protein TehA-like permease